MGISRFDIVEAWFLFLSHYYEGPGCPFYKRLCKIDMYFKPRMNLSHDTLTEDGKCIYKKLVERYHA